MLLRIELKNLLLLVISTAVMSPSIAKDIVSTQNVFQVSGTRFWEAEARCDDFEEPLKLRRGQGQDDWCSMDYEDVCGTDRVTVGLAICERAREVRAEEAERALAREKAIAMRPALLQEKQDIEAKLIELKKKGLELQRQELELKQTETP